MCPKEFFDWTSFSMNLSRFVTIFRLWAECSVKLLQKLERSCQKCLLLEQQNFSRKLCFLKKKFTFTIFSSFDVKLRRLLSENLPPGLKNCFLHSFKGSSCITLSFSSRNFTPTNGLWGEKIGIFSKIFFDMVVKSVFFVCRGHFWRNHFLFHKISKFFSCFQTLRKTFRIFGENLLVGLSKLFSSVQGIFLESIFGLGAQIVWTFGENFAIGLSKLHSMCPVEIFDWTVFSTIIFEFFHRLRAMRKCFWRFGAKASKSFSELQSMCTKNICGKFDFWKNFYNFFEYWSIVLRSFVKNF